MSIIRLAVFPFILFVDFCSIRSMRTISLVLDYRILLLLVYFYDYYKLAVSLIAVV